jgi:hypothetical protein
MRFVATVGVCALMLGGCVGGISSERMATLKAQVAALKVERDAHRITYTQWAKQTSELALATGAATPDDKVGLAYMVVLAGKVDRGEMRPEFLDLEMAKVGAASAAIDQQRQQATSQALLATGAALMTAPVNPIQPVKGPISCTSTRLGQFVQTTC